nr:MAG TPA: hypothetical protein [Caudoviricetes sp.]
MKKLTKNDEWFSPLSKISDQRLGYLIGKDWIKLMQAFIYNSFSKCKTIWFGSTISNVIVTTETTFVKVNSTNVGSVNLGNNMIFDISDGNITLVNFQSGCCTLALSAEFNNGNADSYRYIVVQVIRNSEIFLDRGFKCDVQTRAVGNLAGLVNFNCLPNDVIKIGVREGGSAGNNATATINFKISVDLEAQPIVVN